MIYPDKLFSHRVTKNFPKCSVYEEIFPLPDSFSRPRNFPGTQISHDLYPRSKLQTIKFRDRLGSWERLLNNPQINIERKEKT